jgi:MFS family permease
MQAIVDPTHARARKVLRRAPGGTRRVPGETRPVSCTFLVTATQTSAAHADLANPLTGWRGSLLLLFAGVGDLLGRKLRLTVGLVGFSVVSGIAGAAQSFRLLVAARGLQGAFGALLAPSALSILPPRSRNHASAASPSGSTAA